MSDSAPAFDPALHAYSRSEEVANALTHGVGAALSAAGLTLLLVLTHLFGDGWQLASAIVYGSSLVVLYSVSTLYHALSMPRLKHLLKVFDHSAIYLLIAGTYTPFTLVTLRPAGGLWLFGIIWGLAVVGMACEAFWVYRPRWISVAIYVAMGWMVLGMVKPLVARLSTGGLTLLIAGGVAYTAGTVFYVWRRFPYTHAIWHVIVLAGSICHFLSVALYVVTRPA